MTMKAIILAAGLGKRMRPLTNDLPKPLLNAGGKMLIEYHLEALANAGFKQVIINTHWCADKIPAALGSGEKWGLSLNYSHETELLETAGGIRQALSLFCEQEEIFLVINGDIYCEFDIAQWLATYSRFDTDQSACLAMVPNPEQHAQGDFSLSSSGARLTLAETSNTPRYTYAGLALFRTSFFKGLDKNVMPLAPLLKKNIQAGKIVGTIMNEVWMDIGTPERLTALDNYLKQSKKVY